jgi:hypothetical protein
MSVIAADARTAWITGTARACTLPTSDHASWRAALTTRPRTRKPTAISAFPLLTRRQELRRAVGQLHADDHAAPRHADYGAAHRRLRALRDRRASDFRARIHELRRVLHGQPRALARKLDLDRELKHDHPGLRWCVRKRRVHRRRDRVREPGTPAVRTRCALRLTPAPVLLRHATRERRRAPAGQRV